MFVAYEFKSPITLLHSGLLTIPFVAMAIFVNPFLWLLVRANSLTTGGVFQISNKDFLEEKLYNEGFEKFIETKVKTKPVQITAMIVNIALIIVCGVFYFTTV